MASKYLYSEEISNEYLGKFKTVKGETLAELRMKAVEQHRKWADQEERQRERERIADLKEQANYDTKNAQALLNEYETVLAKTLEIDDKLDWDSLKNTRKFKPFKSGIRKPTIDDVNDELGVLSPSIFEVFLKSRKEKRLSQESEAQELWKERKKEHASELKNLKQEYEEAKAEFLRKQAEENESIDQLKVDFEQGHGYAIEKYVHLVLESSQYPEGLERAYEIQYEPISGTVIVAFQLPIVETLPNISKYKYVAPRKEIDPVPLKKKELDALFENLIFQICLRTTHEIFESVYVDDVQTVVFNGWVQAVDPKTGQDFDSCIVSCQAQREQFESFNLERVGPKECFKNLKGLAAGPLAQLAPVKPIFDISRDDKRFVASQDVLEALDDSMNLAEMDWADFEHLVRELFSFYFSKNGGEVNVTQASRDGGVDAIAFDPDPIRGGKFVIQAKRYNNVVPVSAARELYGTMVAEGASKGILVTTSYYGSDSREFVKDKPISLIDGSNLVYMFQEFGHNVKIELQRNK